MPELAAEIREFRGLLPGVDRKRVEEPYVVDGKNFLVDLDGPVSIFGRQWLIHEGFDEPRGAQTIRGLTTSQFLYATHDALMQYDEDSRQFYPVYRHATRSAFWPWSRARVGTKLYLANYEVGLVEYDNSAGTFTLVSGGTNIPATVFACTESGGRLVLLSDDSILWSKIDDASDSGFTPSTSTGAGAQALSIICSSLQPYTVKAYADGFLTYTCSGILRSERVDAANPFRHRVLSRDHVILNPWCVVAVTEQNRDQHLLLTKRGFFVTLGYERPEAWQPLVGEYLHRTVLPTLDTALTDMTTRLDYNNDKGWLAVAIAEDSRDGIFSRTFVYYMPSEQWGLYSRSHCGFVELRLDNAATTGFHYGVVGVDGTVFRFAETDSDRRYPDTDLWNVDLQTTYDIPAQYQGLSDANKPAYMPSLIMLYSDNVNYLDDAAVYNLRTEISETFSPVAIETDDDIAELDSGTYHMGSFAGTQVGLLRLAFAPITHTDYPLDAEITIGPLRQQGVDKIDGMVELVEMYIGMLESGIGDTFEDYINDYVDQEPEFDYNTLSGSEDWGTTTAGTTDYDVAWIGTLDGYNTIVGDDDTEQEITPSLVEQTGRSRHVDGTVLGLYPYVKFTATEVGHSFHLKMLRYNAINAGQYF